jgi:hypothetical protein
MKQTLGYSLLLFILSQLFVLGQDKRVENLKVEDLKRLRFGYYIDFNSVGAKMEYATTPDGQPPFRLAVKPKPSFGVGLLADYRIHEFVNIRFHPGIAFVEREINFPFSEDQLSKALISRNVKSNYVRFPIGIKFNTRRIRNVRPYLMGSFSTNINITSEEKNTEDNQSGTFRMKQRMNAWEFAIGTEIYLPYFKFTPSVHGVFGLDNEFVPDKDPNSPFTQYISSMKSRGVFLRFTFE